MTAPCTPFFNRSGGFGVTGSPSAGWTFTKTAQASTAELIATFGVSDDAVGALTFRNGSATDAAFSPQIRGVEAGTGVALRFLASATTDTGTTPVMTIDSARAVSTAITTRPLLDFRNAGAAILSLLPLNSGANSTLSWGTQAQAAPAFTTRSAGTRLILRESMSGSTTDMAIGLSGTGTMWLSMVDATSARSIDFYGGTTIKASIRGDGQLTTTGSKVDKLRVALTTPVTVVAGTDYIVVSNLTTPGAVAVNLPATPATGLTYVIKDGKGDAAANNITITPAAGNIDGAGTLVLATNYARAVLVYNGTEWNVIT